MSAGDLQRDLDSQYFWWYSSASYHSAAGRMAVTIGLPFKLSLASTRGGGLAPDSLLLLNLGGDSLCDVFLLLGMGEDATSVFCPSDARFSDGSSNAREPRSGPCELRVVGSCVR